MSKFNKLNPFATVSEKRVRAEESMMNIMEVHREMLPILSYCFT